MGLDWKDIVKSVAPTLGAALGGPLAGAATKVIAEKILGKSEASDGEVSSFVLGATPEQLLELKRADHDFKLRTQQLGVDVFAIEVRDRESAREMFKVNHYPQMIITGVVLFAWMGVLILLLMPSVASNLGIAVTSEWYKGVLGGMFGGLTAHLTQIMSFWFGSSQGSQFKTGALAGGGSK